MKNFFFRLPPLPFTMPTNWRQGPVTLTTCLTAWQIRPSYASDQSCNEAANLNFNIWRATTSVRHVRSNLHASHSLLALEITRTPNGPQITLKHRVTNVPHINESLQGSMLSGSTLRSVVFKITDLLFFSIDYKVKLKVWSTPPPPMYTNA